jgi:hypothetical protein
MENIFFSPASACNEFSLIFISVLILVEDIQLVMI